ncbi:putative serine incorporator [Schistosoma japonicum]|nr:putative serine incorporator [Schistosoma japonicum]
MGCLVQTLKCSFGANPCFLCCVKNARESTTTRLAYTLILVLITFISTASHEGGVLSSLYSKYRRNFDWFCTQIGAGEGCYRLIGYVGVYRICLSLFTFHFLMSLVTITVSSSQTFRGKIHNGYWLLKILFIVSLWITAYLFPFLETLIRVWMVMGIVGGMLFVYVQHITLIDFAYEINGNWHNKSKNSIFYTLAIYVVTLLLYGVTVCAYIAFVLLYGLPHQCTLNLTVTGINAGLTLLFAVCSAFSTILRKGQMWLPGAITSAFVAFLTWSALTSQPRILSSNFPWQKQTMKKLNDAEKQQNLTIHPLVVVADQLNRLLSHQFVQTNPVKTTPISTSNMKSNNTEPIILVNECLPGGVNRISEHLGKDIVTVLGITVVISGFLYSSFRASMQARRLGIRTRRERLKALLPPLHESGQFNEFPSRTSNCNKSTEFHNPTNNVDKSPVCFMNHKDVKRQERALNLLADAVAGLPNPKVFRRPSARQPRLNLQPSSRSTNSPSQNIENNVGDCGVATKKDKLPSSSSHDNTDKNHNAAATIVTNTTPSTSTLRLASSEPDLTVTMRNYSRRRGDIRDLDWSMINYDDVNNKSSKHKAGIRFHEYSFNSPNHRIGYLRHKKLKRSKSQLKSTNLPNNNKANGIYGNNLSPIAVTSAEEKHDDALILNETKPKLHFKKKLKKTWRETCRLNSNEKRIVNDLYLFSADGLPEKVGPNTYLSVSPATNNPIPILPNVARRSPLAVKNYPQPLDLLTADSSTNQHSPHDAMEYFALTSPNHLRYRQARWASEIVLNKRTSGLFNVEPGLVNSLSFLGTMLNTAAPRDGYTMYNEAIASVYSYPWFHFIYALATLYLMTQLTNWYNPQISRVDTLSESWANMWMKLASSWLALVLYAWTIACPRLCIGRKLGAVPFTPRTPRAKISQTVPIV